MLHKIAMRRHPRQFDGAPQRQLAPLPFHLRLLEGTHQTSGFLPKFLAGGGELLHFRAQTSVRFLPGRFDLVHLGAEFVDGLLQRFDHSPDRNFALLEVA